MVVLDTHAWLWWVDDPRRLGAAAREAIAAAETVGVPSVCCWEVAMLAERGRIAVAGDIRAWIRQALSQPGSLALPLSPSAAVDAALLGREGFAGDPADRLIYATARERGARLATRDARIREFDRRGTVW